MDRVMDKKPRIVQCPKCRALLQEPPPGNPFYECGSCFATLQAKHATQEDLDIRMQQKALLKRMESDKKTKSVSSEEGYKVFHSDSSNETAEREEHSYSGEGSPSWSPSRWESPLYGPKPGRSSQVFQQRQAAESLEKSQYHPQNVASRAKPDLAEDNVEALGQNLHRLGVEDSSEAHLHSTSPLSPDWAHGQGSQPRPSTMRRPRSEEFLAKKDTEGHQVPVHQVQKSVSFKQNVVVASVDKQHALGGERGFLSKDVHQAARVSPLMRGEPNQHVVESLQLPANYDGRSQHMIDGSENQRDMYAAADILEYETSEYASVVGDVDAYQGMVLESHSRPSSGELDSYVVLDHRVTRPGAYQRSSSGGKNASTNPGYQHAADSYDKHQFEADHLSQHQHLEWSQTGASQTVSRVQQRPTVTSYHVQQPSHIPSQVSMQSPPHFSHNKPPAGQNGHALQESNHQTGMTGAGTYPSLPRPDEAPYVVCQHCGQLLTVPSNLPPTKQAYQKLRCGACMKISVFLLVSDDHISAQATSPKGPGTVADFSSAYRLRSSSPPETAPNGRHASPGSRPQVDAVDRGHPPTSGGSQRLPPTVRNFPRVSSGSKLSAMSSATNGTAVPAHTPVPNSSSNLHPVGGAMPTRGTNFSHFGDGMSSRPTHTPAGPNGDHVVYALVPRGSSGSDYEGYHLHDGRFHQTSSESDNDSPRHRVPRIPSTNSFQNEQFYTSSHMARDHNVAQQYSKAAGYTQGANWTTKGLKGIIKKGVKELTKTKQGLSANQYRRKVTVNGSAVPDVLVKRAEGLAGPIHPGSYWYDPQAGFWGLSGGPCLGIIPPYIEELNIPLSRHCSGGQTGVLVNGRELHKSDYDRLVRRGLPATPGMTYNLDIDGRLKEVVSGTELRGLGPLAPTLEQTGRGHGMWIPGSSKVA